MISVQAAARLVARRAAVYSELDEDLELAYLERRLPSPDRAREAIDLALVRRLVIRRGSVLLPPVDWRAEIDEIPNKEPT